MIVIYKISLRIIVILIFILQIDIVFSLNYKVKHTIIGEKDSKKKYFCLLEKKMAINKVKNVLILYNYMIVTKTQNSCLQDFSMYFIYMLCKIILQSSIQNKYNNILISIYFKSLEYLNLVEKLPGAGLEPA